VEIEARISAVRVRQRRGVQDGAVAGRRQIRLTVKVVAGKAVDADAAEVVENVAPACQGQTGFVDDEPLKVRRCFPTRAQGQVDRAVHDFAPADAACGDRDARADGHVHREGIAYRQRIGSFRHGSRSQGSALVDPKSIACRHGQSRDSDPKPVRTSLNMIRRKLQIGSHLFN